MVNTDQIQALFFQPQKALQLGLGLHTVAHRAVERIFDRQHRSDAAAHPRRLPAEQPAGFFRVTAADMVKHRLPKCCRQHNVSGHLV